MVRWPGVTRAGTVDEKHMISAVDMLPTLLDIAGAKHPTRLDGRSFLPLIHAKTQTGRDRIFKEYNENAGASRDPMRAVQTKRYLYLFNPWSNGSRVFATATTGTMTYRRMVALAQRDERLAKRLDLYKHRVPEELYDVANDPDCLHNLITEPKHQAALAGLRADLDGWMKRTKDPMLAVFHKREDAAYREAYVQKVEKEAIQRRKNRPPKNKRTKKKR
jgi:N-sulfoglucosamine sulfohydrolase